MTRRLLAPLVLVVAALACKGNVVSPLTDGPAPETSSTVPAGSPLSRLKPAAKPGPRALCPLTIEPGVALGPVQLGETLAELEAAGLKVEKTSGDHAELTLSNGTRLKLTLCEGKIVEVWIDDLRLAPSCVAFGPTTFSPTVPREDLEKALGGCVDTEPRIGGAFERCQDGGVYVGHGMGDFLQLRVRPKAWRFDDVCAWATDDGSPAPVAPAERFTMLKKALDLPELSPYWHPDVPGRDPLRIVRTPLVPEEPLTMFGSPVVWIDEADAKKGTAFLRITSLVASRTRATLSFEYPIEGVQGSATFVKVHGPSFRFESGSVHER